jgi:hypothetical protein
MRTRTFAPLSVGLALLFAAGCTSYYRINDQSSGRIYYTTDYDRSEGGAVVFQDTRTRSTVTLQSSEIREIRREEYEAGLKK